MKTKIELFESLDALFDEEIINMETYQVLYNKISNEYEEEYNSMESWIC